MQTKKLGFKVALFALAALGVGLAGPGVGVVQAQPEHAPELAPSAVRAPQPGAQELLVRAKRASAAPTLERRLRRLKRADLSTAMMLASAEVVKRHYGRPFGSEVALEIEGKPYVARIERHFHPEGGSVKPWGYHPGVSLFAVEWRAR
jgi:hypothetical protein